MTTVSSLRFCQVIGNNFRTDPLPKVRFPFSVNFSHPCCRSTFLAGLTSLHGYLLAGEIWATFGSTNRPQFWHNSLTNGTTRKTKQQLLSLRVVPSSSIPYRFGVFDAAFAVAFPDGFFCSLDLLPDLAPWGWLPFVIIELLAT